MISGFQASNIGQYGIEDFSWSQGGRIGSFDLWQAPGDAGPIPGVGTSSPFFENPILDALGQIIATWWESGADSSGTPVPVVLPGVTGPQASLPVDESAGAPPVVSQTPTVIDPDYRPEYTVYENAPGGIYEVERAPTDWDAYYRRYEELNYDAYEAEGDREMFDWLQGATTLGQLGSAVGWWGGDQAATASPVVQPGGPSGPVPARVTVDTRTGKVTACKRRRRRKLLTESDFNVLLRVATLPNKENVRIVLGKAIGRG